MRFYAIIAALVAVAEAVEVNKSHRKPGKDLTRGEKARRDITHYMDAKQAKCARAMESTSESDDPKKSKEGAAAQGLGQEDDNSSSDDE